MKEPKVPRFYYGPKDGSVVPEMFWILDSIQYAEISMKDDTVLVHTYTLNEQDKNYYYKGVTVKPKGSDDEWTNKTKTCN